MDLLAEGGARMMVPAAQAATQIGSILLICNGTNCERPISNDADGVKQRRQRPGFRNCITNEGVCEP